MTTVLTQKVAKLLLAPILMVALAVLVKGYADVGDGFAAGVIAALGLVLQWLTFGPEAVERLLSRRLSSAATFVGLLAALTVAFAPTVRGDELLEHLPAPGAEVVKLGTLELVTAVAFDVAVFVLVLGAVLAVLGAMATSEGERR